MKQLTATDLAFGVRPLVEVREQEVEHDRMGTNEVRESAREVALVPEQQLEGVGHHQDELDLF